MPCGWVGNRRSSVALVMRHRLQWFIHLRAHGLSKGDEHPAYTCHGIWHSLPLTVHIGVDFTNSSSRSIQFSLCNVERGFREYMFQVG